MPRCSEHSIDTRHQNRNDEKYVKNAERNHQRAIDVERRQIQNGAIRQAEALAAIHDLSGKMFNVGEMIKMPDGQIKSKDKLRETEEVKARRAKEEADFNERVKNANDAFKEARAKLEAQYAADGKEMTTQQIQRLRQQYPVPVRISNKQKARREALAPRPIPPKPVIPKGFSIPEGEEDLLALWDITDEEIVKRINRRKKEKTQAARELRRIQKEKKKFNRAMKVLKKQCAHDGILWDPVKAEKEVLGQLAEESDSGSEAENDDSDADSDSGSKSDSSSDSNSDSENEVVDRNGKKLKKAEIKLKGGRPKIDLELLAKANEFEAALKQKKKDKKDKRKQERREKEAKEAVEMAAAEAAEKSKLEGENNVLEEAGRMNTFNTESSDDSASKKRKRTEDPVEDAGAPRKAEKKAKKADKTKYDIKDETAPTQLSREHNTSKRKRVEAADEDGEANVSTEKREKKKTKKLSKVEPEVIPMDDIKSLISELVNPETAEDAETKAKREKRERKAAKKSAKSEIRVDLEGTPVIKPGSVNEDEEAKAKRERQERKEAKRAAKASKAKLPESADDKLDRQIAEQQAKIKSDVGEAKIEAPIAEQWNPDALTGDDARKSKFMRLLGAGKGKTDGEKKPRAGKDAKKMVEEISKVQSELERQYESGMKMKHDGGGKRRGLGA